MSVITVVIFFLNVISTDLLAKSNYEISIKKNFYDIILNSVTILRGQLNNGIYIVFKTNVIYISNKCPRMDDITDAYLWYCRLDHINKNRINRLAQEKILDKHVMNHYLPVRLVCLER